MKNISYNFCKMILSISNLFNFLIIHYNYYYTSSLKNYRFKFHYHNENINDGYIFGVTPITLFEPIDKLCTPTPKIQIS
jgi:predicted acetyltransferase